MTRHAFSWQVDKYDVIVPESEDVSPMFIECARGTKSGRACFYVRREDADKFFTLASVDITAKVFTQEDDSDEWTEGEPLIWKSYIPAERSEVDEYGNVYVTLRDKRWLLERAGFDRPFNQVYIVGLTSAGTRTLVTIYEDEWCNGANTPFTFAEIVFLLFFGTGLTTPSLGSVPTFNPDNIQARGSRADILGRLFYSVGCDLVLDPFNDTLSVVLLSDTQDLTTIETAKTDGKLISKVTRSLQASERIGTVVALPSDYFPVRNVFQDSSSFGGGGLKSLVIRDHQLADETTKKATTARMAEIVEAVQNWHLAENDLKDETYFGLLEIIPGENLRSITWHLADDEKGHRTRIVNDVVPMEWPERVEYQCPEMLRGVTVSTVTHVPTKVKYYKSTGGFFADSGFFVEAHTDPGTIVTAKEVAMWPADKAWYAVKVCP